MAKREELAGRISLVVLMAAGATACVSRVGLESASVAPDPDTEIGRAMIDATRNPGPYPRFSDIPRVAALATSQAEAAQATAGLASQGQALSAQIAALEPASESLTETEAARLRALLAISPPPTDSAAQTEAFARALRQRAKPPPAPR